MNRRLPRSHLPHAPDRRRGRGAGPSPTHPHPPPSNRTQSHPPTRSTRTRTPLTMSMCAGPCTFNAVGLLSFQTWSCEGYPGPCPKKKTCPYFFLRRYRTAPSTSPQSASTTQRRASPPRCGTPPSHQDISATMPRHLRDTSETPPKVPGTSETFPRPFRGTIFRDVSETLPKDGLSTPSASD